MCGELAFVQDGEVGRLKLYLDDVSDCNCIVISKSYLDMQAECFFPLPFPWMRTIVRKLARGSSGGTGVLCLALSSMPHKRREESVKWKKKLQVKEFFGTLRELSETLSEHLTTLLSHVMKINNRTWVNSFKTKMIAKRSPHLPYQAFRVRANHDESKTEHKNVFRTLQATATPQEQ